MHNIILCTVENGSKTVFNFFFQILKVAGNRLCFYNTLSLALFYAETVLYHWLPRCCWPDMLT